MEQECCVCGEPLDSEHSSQCQLCGGYFHMAWSAKAQVKECGRYRFREMAGGIMFVCACCEEQTPAEES